MTNGNGVRQWFRPLANVRISAVPRGSRHVSAFRLTPWHAHPVVADQPLFRVTYVAPSGFKYEMIGKASSEVEAVRLADETLEYVERISINEHLREDGTTVRPPARLEVERIPPDGATPGLGLVMTAPNGTVTRK